MFWEFVSFLELQVNMYLLRVIALLEYFIVVVRTFPAENYMKQRIDQPGPS